MHAEGQLAAEQDDEGRWVFTRAHLEALRDSGAAAGGKEKAPAAGGNGSGAASQPPTARRTLMASDIERELYQGLAQGEPIEQLVLTLGLDPSWARQRVAAWQRLNGGVSVGERVDDVAGEVDALRRRVRKLEDMVSYLRSEHEVAVALLGGMVGRME